MAETKLTLCRVGVGGGNTYKDRNGDTYISDKPYVVPPCQMCGKTLSTDKWYIRLDSVVKVQFWCFKCTEIFSVPELIQHYIKAGVEIQKLYNRIQGAQDALRPFVEDTDEYMNSV